MSFPSPGDLPDPGIEPKSPALQADALPSEPPGKPQVGLLHWLGIKPGSTAWKAAMLSTIPPMLKVKEESEKVGLMLNIQKTKIMASGPISSVQFSRSVMSDSLRPMNRSMPGLPVHHELREFTQTHVQRAGDTIQPSNSLSSPSPLAPNPSQHQSLFQ